MSQYRVANSWSFLRLSFDLPTDIVSLINSVHLPRYSTLSDKITWGLTNSKLFTISSCYNDIFSSTHPNTSIADFSWIWNFDVPTKLRHFLWLLNHNRLPITSYLYHIHCIDSPYCLICHSSTEETASHLFIHCKSVDPLWAQLNIITQVHRLREVIFEYQHPSMWLHCLINLVPHQPIIPHVPNKVLLTYCLWSIWLARNRTIFQNIPFKVSVAHALALST